MLIRIVCACFFVLGICLTPTSAKTDRVAESPVPVVYGKWSETSEGISGRLVASADHRLANTQILGLSLQLQTQVGSPRLLRTGPGVADVEVLDTDGKPLAQPNKGVFRSGLVPGPQWAVLPAPAKLEFRLDWITAGVRPDSGAVLDLQSSFWELPPGRYTIKGIYQCPTPPPEVTSSKSQPWTGKIDMTVDITVPLR